MKKLLLSAVLVCAVLLASCVSPLAAGGAGEGAAARQRAVIATEQQRVDALVHGDYAALDRIFADELTYSHTSGVVDTKTSFLRKLTSGQLKYLSLDHSAEQVRLYGDTAILTGLTKVVSVLDGQESRPTVNFLTVYLWRDGAWRLVAWHATRLPDP